MPNAQLADSSQPDSLTPWRWQEWQALPYLTCSLLDRWPHGFFTRQFSPRSPADLTTVLDPTAEVLRVRQVHGDRVLLPQEIQAENVAPQILSEASATSGEQSTYPPADGILTNGAGQTAWVCSADCTPALLADVRTGAVAAVHAGWRGTAARILPKAIERMQAHGSQLGDLRVALGPAIAGEVYQVETAVAAEVVGSIDLTIEAALNLNPAPLLADAEPGKLRLDVRQVNVQQLLGLGLQPDQVAIAPHCTYQEPERFFSYRRDRAKRVQWSGIVGQ